MNVFKNCVNNAATVQLWQVMTIRITELKLHCARVGINQVGIQKLENCINDVLVNPFFPETANEIC
jgi:hypothetical protein